MRRALRADFNRPTPTPRSSARCHSKPSPPVAVGVQGQDGGPAGGCGVAHLADLLATLKAKELGAFKLDVESPQHRGLFAAHPVECTRVT